MHRGKAFPLGLFCHSVGFSRPHGCNHNLDLKEDTFNLESAQQSTYYDNNGIKITHWRNIPFSIKYMTIYKNTLFVFNLLKVYILFKQKIVKTNRLFCKIFSNFNEQASAGCNL